MLRNGECFASYSSRVQCSSVQLYCPCGEICFAAITKSITINSKHFSCKHTQRKQSARGQRGPPPGPSLIVQQKAVVTRRHVFCCYTFTAPHFTSTALRLDANSSNREQSLVKNLCVSGTLLQSFSSLRTRFSKAPKLGHSCLQCLKIS